jgi:hypothetical protein
MDRREAIFKVATLMGVTLSAPLISGLVYGQGNTLLDIPDGYISPLATDTQQKMIAEIAELIIPTTSTPGAKAAKVPEFINVLITDCYPKQDQKRFFEGLDKLDADAKSAHGKGFLTITKAQQTALLKKAEAEAQALRKTKPGAPAPFFQMIKEMTVTGYFTSEIGATKALNYVAVPGAFRPCEPLKPGQKSWAT